MRTRPFLTTAAVVLASLPLVFAQTPPPPPSVANQPAAPAPTPVQAPAAPVQAPPDAAKLADKPAAPEVAVKTDEAKNSVAKSKDATGKDTLSVDFPDEDIRNILRNVADLFELNLVMPETLQGKTSIKLRDVTWRQIFQNVLAPVNYTYTEEGNIIKIVSIDSLGAEPVTTEVFLINYARAADIMPTVTSLVDTGAGGKIVVDSRSNSLVITERPTRMNRIRPIIEQLDRATDQVMIESKFVEVTTDNSKNVGVNWSSLANYQISAGNLTQTFSSNGGQTASNGSNGSLGTTGVTTNGTTGSTTNGTNGSTTNATNGSSTNGTNTTSSVTSSNGTPTTTSTTGANGALTTTTTTSVSNGTTTTTTTGTNNGVTDTLNSASNLLSSVANTSGTSRAVTALFSASQFNLVLSALQTLSDVKIVSNPTIVTLNNSEASINIGESDPLPNYTFNPQTGTQEVSGFTYKDIGIILKVTPQVNARGDIKLTLNPEVSQKNGTLTFGAAQLPIIATRKASTTISLHDGYTMGIGGLLTTQTTKAGTKVPILGSIPGLGRLFSSDSLDKSVTNLIIFITAKTLAASGAPVEQVFESQRVRDLQMRREDLPGYRDGSNPFLPTPDASKSGEKPPAKKSFFGSSTSEENK